MVILSTLLWIAFLALVVVLLMIAIAVKWVVDGVRLIAWAWRAAERERREREAFHEFGNLHDHRIV